MKTSYALTLLILLALPQIALSDDLTVLSEKNDGPAPADMMKRYLLGLTQEAQQRWNDDFESRKTPSAIGEYQQQMRKFFIDQIGGLPERTPLNAKTVGRVERDGFRVEKVIFESQPQHYVTAALFLPRPDQHQAPYPGVLVACGHSSNGKGYEMYQQVCANLARHGMAALIYDPIGQGERIQRLDENGKPVLRGTAGHTMVGMGSILVGRNTALYRIWDGMRAIDYLQSRKDIDPKKIGCTGNSGGGTMTAYLMALDDRIVAAAPSCYLCGLYDRMLRSYSPQDAEQNIFGQLKVGMDHADYLMMRAPKPTLMCVATHDYFNINGAWDCFRRAKRTYARLGYPERIDLVENDDKHGFRKPLRIAAVRWMSRWLLARDVPIKEPDIHVLSDEEIQCTSAGQVMLLPGARSVYDLNFELESKLIAQRKKLWTKGNPEKALDQVRKLAGVRILKALPTVKAEPRGKVARKGYQIEKLLLRTEPGIGLPALRFEPADASTRKGKDVILYLHDEGKQADARQGGPIEQLVNQGHTVLAVDLRGIGETKRRGQKYHTLFASDGDDIYLAYLLGRSYVGMRIEDILSAARYLQKTNSSHTNSKIRLVSIGALGVPALHAAALESNLFSQIEISKSLTSYRNLVQNGISHNQLQSLVHRALTVYDLPDLAATLEGRITIKQPVDAMEKAID